MSEKRTCTVVIDDSGRWNGEYTIVYLDNIQKDRLLDRLEKKHRRRDMRERAVQVAQDYWVEKCLDWELEHQPDFECTPENKKKMFRNTAGGEVVSRVLREADEIFLQEDMAIEKN